VPAGGTSSSGDVDPLLTALGEGTSSEVALPRFDSPDGTGSVVVRGVPTRTVAGHLVTTVFDLLLASYGVGRDGLPGQWPTGYDDPSTPCTPAWQASSPACPPRRPSASAASSPRTRSTPVADR
jgi:nitrate reductase alpha subunit